MNLSGLAALPEILEALEKLLQIVNALEPFIKALDDETKSKYREKYYNEGLNVKIEVENTRMIIILQPIRKMIDTHPEI